MKKARRHCRASSSSSLTSSSCFLAALFLEYQSHHGKPDTFRKFISGVFSSTCRENSFAMPLTTISVSRAIVDIVILPVRSS
jgi:hypothetical protein